MNRRVDPSWIGVLLCAGLGTRLRPLTNWVPKPLVPIVDRPLAHFAAAQLGRAGSSLIELNAYHLASQLEDFARSLAQELMLEVRCHVEAELLGTGGGIAALRCEQRLMVVWNGDIFAPELSLDWVNDRCIEVPTLVVAPVRSDAGHSKGTLGLDAAGQVVRVRGRRYGVECRGADYVGVAALPAAFTATLPAQGCLIADGVLPWLAAGKPVHTYTFEGYWSDGGTLEDYLRQNRYWLQRTARTNYVGERAQCSLDVTLVDSVVGRAAQVSGRGVVERSIIWPGARAIAPLSDAVVLPNGEVIRAVKAEAT